MRTLLSLPFAAIGFSVAFTFIGSVSGQTILVKDSFTLTGTRTAGSSLTNTSPEVHVVRGNWAGGTTGFSTGRFTEDGMIVVPSKDNVYTSSLDARIAIPQPTTKITTVSVDIIAGSNPNGGWQSVGFLSSATPPSSNVWFGSTDAMLWVYIKPNGGWAVYTNGLSIRLQTGTLNGFSPTNSYTLGISYDPVSGKARAFIKSGETEKSLVSSDGGWFSTGLARNTPVGAAGMHVNIGGGGISAADNPMSLDNFLVTTTP